MPRRQAGAQVTAEDAPLYQEEHLVETGNFDLETMSSKNPQNKLPKVVVLSSRQYS